CPKTSRVPINLTFDTQPLGRKIPHLLTPSLEPDDSRCPHTLQGVPYGLLWAEIRPDLLSGQSFGMVSQEGQDALAHGTTGLLWCRSCLWRYFCLPLIVLSHGLYIFCLSSSVPQRLWYDCCLPSIVL